MKKHWVALAGILAVGLILRIIVVGTRGIWYDDAFSILLAERSLLEIINGTAADTMPPLYYFLLHAWLVVSRSIVWIRFLNVMLSLGVLVLLYLMGRAMGGNNAGLAAVLLGAISPLQVYHAQEVRMYILLALAQLAYAWFFLRIWRTHDEGRSSPLDWIGLILCGTTAMYSHNLAVFGLVVPSLYVIANRRWRLLFKLIAAQAVVGLLSLPWLLLVPDQINKIQQAFWTPRPGVVEVLQAMMLFTSNLPLPVVWMALALFLSFSSVMIVIMESRRAYHSLPGLSLLVSWILIPPVLLFVVSYAMRPVFVPRGFLISMLMFLVLAGVLIARTWKAGVGKVLLGAFVAAALVSLPYQYRYAEFPRSPYQQAATYLALEAQPRDRIIHDNKLSYFPMAYYQPDLPQSFVADEPGSHNDTLAFVTQSALKLYADPDIAYAAGQAGRVYFVVFSAAIEEYQEMGLDDHPRLVWLQQRYTLQQQQVFGDLQIYEFATGK